MENYAKAGDRVLIVANHTSLLDGVLLYAWLPQTPTFAINTRIAASNVFKPFLQFVDLFLMDPANPLSVKSMVKFLKEDRKAVIFPEGRITTTGVLMKIYEGPGLIADRAEAMILPIAIEGAQYSPFSYVRGRVKTTRFPNITIKVLPPEKIIIDKALQGNERRKAAALAMQEIMYSVSFACYDYNKTLFAAALEARDTFGKRRIILEDINREPLTYSQFIARCFILARALRTDTSMGEHVGLLLPNVNAMPVCYMALQYLGRVPAMLNYTAGTEALIKACETASVKTLYTARRFVENAALEDSVSALERHVTVIYLEDLRTRISLFDKLIGLLRSQYPRAHYRRVVKNAAPDKPATILFTSGSEGIAKGVVLTHKNILSNYAQVRCLINFDTADVMFSCLPLFHAFGLNVGFIMPFLSGAKVFLYPTPLHYRLIPELIYELGATILLGTNTFYKGYARHAHPYDMHTLRLAVAGAEKFSDDTQQLWMEKFGIRVLQGYGLTETSPVSAFNTLINHQVGSVGRLLPNMQACLEPVEGIDTGGRLIVNGPNVMLGYLLHGLNGQIQKPAASGGEGWHDTGDIATISKEGFITILGRAKRFAKIGGEMVSLTAVEELAGLTWPDFNHAAVALADERKGEKIILVSDCGQANRKQFQQKAKELKYGELYIPRKVVLAEALPVLGTGKTDYLTLTEMLHIEEQENTGWLRRIGNLVKKPQDKMPADKRKHEAD